MRSSADTALLETSAPYSYTLPTARSLHPVELNPPHWRLVTKRSLRSRLKDLVLKTPADGLPAQTTTPKSNQQQLQRPAIMRMKDSDDYITARAANPRTGLISPSIGSPSPQPFTPDTPGDALKLPKQTAPSPTPEARSRPALSRANEGRKISGGTLNRCAKGWVSGAALAAASPRETPVTVGAGLGSQPMLKDDQFVIHMPSAREPQPYTYPGRTPIEIEAFEHHKRKARRVSGDGYGQGQVSRNANGKAFGGVRKTTPTNARAWDGAALATGFAVADAHVHSAAPFPAVTVAKRSGRNFQEDHHPASVAGAELSASTFAPFCSPRTPASRPVAADTVLQTVRVPGASRDGHLGTGTVSNVTPILRKPLPTAPNDGLDIYQTGDSHNPLTSSSLPDLSQLPRVRLVHPQLASVPQMHALRHTRGAPRQCSLGCRREEDTGQCLETRDPSTDGIIKPRSSLFETQAASSTLRTDDVLELLFGLAASALAFGRRIRLPRICALEPLRAPDATPQQKVDALKALLTLAGQGVTLLMVVTVLWRLGAALMQVFEVLFWPLAVPFKILRWLAGYA